MLLYYTKSPINNYYQLGDIMAEESKLKTSQFEVNYKELPSSDLDNISSSAQTLVGRLTANATYGQEAVCRIFNQSLGALNESNLRRLARYGQLGTVEQASALTADEKKQFFTLVKQLADAQNAKFTAEQQVQELNNNALIERLRKELDQFIQNKTQHLQAEIKEGLQRLAKTKPDGWDKFGDVVGCLTDGALAATAATLGIVEGAGDFIDSSWKAGVSPDALPTEFATLGCLEGLNFLANVSLAIREFDRGQTQKAWTRLAGASVSLMASIVCLANKYWKEDFQTATNNVVFFPVIFAAATLASFIPLFVKWAKGEKVEFNKDVLPGVLNFLKFASVMISNGAMNAVFNAVPFGWIALAATVAISKILGMCQKYGPDKPKEAKTGEDNPEPEAEAPLVSTT